VQDQRSIIESAWSTQHSIRLHHIVRFEPDPVGCGSGADVLLPVSGACVTISSILLD
jgi:hypothetical protein